MINFKPAALCVAFAIITASNAYTQTEAVILYNSQAVKVELTENGQIQSFVGVVPGYMDGYDLSTNTVEVIPTTIDEPIFSESVRNADYSVVSTEHIELKYKPSFALLDKVIINELNKISARLKADPNAKILLTAHTSDKMKNKLTTNRLASAIAYLGIKGIQQDRIQSEVQRSDSMINIITVNYLN